MAKKLLDSTAFSRGVLELQRYHAGKASLLARVVGGETPLLPLYSDVILSASAQAVDAILRSPSIADAVIAAVTAAEPSLPLIRSLAAIAKELGDIDDFVKRSPVFQAWQIQGEAAKRGELQWITGGDLDGILVVKEINAHGLYGALEAVESEFEVEAFALILTQ